MRRNVQRGFTLLEVMIFTTILSVVLVSAAAFTTRLIYNLRINEHKILANVYSSELLEWLSSQREANFNTLLNASSTTGSNYCVNLNLTLTTAFSALPTGNCANFNGITGRQPSIFKREMTLVRNAASNQVTATIRVSWQEGTATYSDEIQAIYTSW